MHMLMCVHLFCHKVAGKNYQKVCWVCHGLLRFILSKPSAMLSVQAFAEKRLFQELKALGYVKVVSSNGAQ
jgi:hypothetical protein